jgi:hypothetical protein
VLTRRFREAAGLANGAARKATPGKGR